MTRDGKVIRLYHPLWLKPHPMFWNLPLRTKRARWVPSPRYQRRMP